MSNNDLPISVPKEVPMSNKTEEIKDAIESAFPGTKEAIAEVRCPICTKPITGFKDELSVREYKISGLCQDCQDEVFSEPDHDT